MGYYDNDRRYDRFERNSEPNEDRNWFERATDEVSSWFRGDDNDSERYGRSDRRSGDGRWSSSDRDPYQTGPNYTHNARRADGYNYDYDNDFDGGHTYSRYGGPREEHRGTQNIRSYGRDREYNGSGRRNQFESDYESSRGYYGQDSSESYRGNRPMSSQGTYGGMNERYGSSGRSEYGRRSEQPGGNYEDRGRYSYNGGDRMGSAGRYSDTQYGTSGNWGGMEDRSYMGGRHSAFDMNEGRTGRNDWSNPRYGESRYGESRYSEGRNTDGRYNDQRTNSSQRYGSDQ
jgi:hypothetical protein